ncbi:MAG: DJ-1/PfpI family protein [Candidatus Eremiobacterota bacterium]
MKKAYVLIFDGYADWEVGYILPELRRICKIDVVTAGFTDKTVVSMGGLHVIPDTVLSKVNMEDILVFILPGGHMWEVDYPVTETEEFLHRLEKAKIPVAAICAATTVLARAGLVHNRKHTSNSLKYLSKMVPSYSDSDFYIDSLAAGDDHIITASGLGAIEFTMEIFNELNLISSDMKKMWYNAIKHGIYPEGIEEKQF